ncbi:MAG: hypothetical protein QM667_07780 [Asticcacaulis sp.]
MPGWVSTLLICLVPVALIVVFLAGLPAPVTMMSASLRAETVQMVVNTPDEGAFSLPMVRIGEDATCRHAVVVRPGVGAVVTYTREMGQSLVIGVTGPASWDDGERLLGRQGDGEVSYFTVSADCGWAGTLRLPVAGQLSVGTLTAGADAQTRSMPLLAGEMHVYGRSIDSLFWGTVPVKGFEGLTPLEAGRLYLAYDQPLPPGSRLGRAFLATPGGSTQTARWWGFVDVDMTAGGANERGMLIEAATNATALELYAPTPRPDTQKPDQGRPDSLEPDRISLSLGARLAGDPNVRWCLAVLGALALIIGLGLQFQQAGGATDRKPGAPQ